MRQAFQKTIASSTIAWVILCIGCIEHYQKDVYGIGDGGGDADGIPAGDMTDSLTSLDGSDLSDGRVGPDAPVEIKEVESDVFEVLDAEVFVPDVCTPQCTGLECGDDGCGNQCGLCSGNETCQSGQCVVTYPWAVTGGPVPFAGESTDGVWALRPFGPGWAPATNAVSDGTWSLAGSVLLGGQ